MSVPKCYLIDERDIEPETSLSLYKATLAWSATRGDRFVISLQRNIYDDPDDVTRLCSLGQVTAALIPKVPRDLLSRMLERLFGRPMDVVQVEGTPDKTFIREMTRKAAPRRAVTGDVSPVEDVKVFIGQRVLYASYDYGRTQVLNLTDEELDSLRQTLNQAGLDPARVIQAPHPILRGYIDEKRT